jgi:hypothetical protein
MKNLLLSVLTIAIAACCPHVDSAEPSDETFCLDPANDDEQCTLPEGGMGRCVELQCVPTTAP